MGRKIVYFEPVLIQTRNIFSLKSNKCLQLKQKSLLRNKNSQKEVSLVAHPVDLHVGLMIKRARALKNMSQGDVATKLNISFQQIQKYEYGSNRISASKLYEIAQMLNVPLSFFFDELLEEDVTQEQDKDLMIIAAIAAIKDQFIKERIITYIDDVSGMTVVKAMTAKA
jgi:transcriptional regulator with XRE-family HTH domain